VLCGPAAVAKRLDDETLQIIDNAPKGLMCPRYAHFGDVTRQSLIILVDDIVIPPARVASAEALKKHGASRVVASQPTGFFLAASTTLTTHELTSCGVHTIPLGTKPGQLC